MASHYVVIARASLAAGLLRPDPVPVNRDEIQRFHKLLDEAIQYCSPSNIQKCKDWLLDYVVPSSARITALGKYLVALCASFDKSDAPDDLEKNLKPTRSSNIRKRLHILYLANDIFHHTKYHTSTPASHSMLTGGLQPHLVRLISSTASFEPSKHVKLHHKLQELLNIWKDRGYYGPDYVENLREAIKNASLAEDLAEAAPDSEDIPPKYESKRPALQKISPFVMPASHGDSSTPYYDLPAGNMMPHIVPNSNLAINPKLVKPLQFVTGPADDYLASVVRDFLDEVASTYRPTPKEDEGIMMDFDEMGQCLTKDEVTGELHPQEAYYGWSIAFCERMKKRKQGLTDSFEDHRGRGRSGSRSNSSGRRKRRRSASSASSRESYSRSPPSRRRARRPPNSRSHSRSSNSPQRRRRGSRSPSPRGPPIRSPPSFYQSNSSYDQRPPSLPSQPQSIPLPPLTTPVDQIDNPIPSFAPLAPSQHNHQPHNFPLGANGLPVPPPPPFHSGPWPPPLPHNMPPGPPPRPSSQGFAGAHFPGLRGFVPPPPPPPPPPPAPGGGGWQTLAQTGGLASPMPVWHGQGHVQNDARPSAQVFHHQQQQQVNDNDRYRQNWDRRRR